LAAILLGSGIVVAALQWRSDAIARRHQLFAQRVEAFYTPKTKAAIQMLLNFDRDVDLFEGRPPIRVSWDLAALSLIPGNLRQYLYEPVPIAIRDCFNELLEQMRRLIYLAENRLVPQDDVDHILQPLLRRIAADRKGKGTRISRNLRLYIEWKRAGKVERLFRRYGWDITKMYDDDRAALKDEITSGLYGRCDASDWGVDEPIETRAADNS
jgi:hypothetical protein